MHVKILVNGVNFAKEHFEQKVSCNHYVTAFAKPHLVWKQLE